MIEPPPVPPQMAIAGHASPVSLAPRKRRRIDLDSIYSIKFSKSVGGVPDEANSDVFAKPFVDNQQNTDALYVSRIEESLPRILSTPKKRRQLALSHKSSSPSHSDQQATEPSSTPTEHSQVLSSLLLSPCHICHRRPTTRAVLDAYTNCEICGRRSCYICLRECGNSVCGLSAERKEEIQILETVYGGSITAHTKVKTKRVCSWCAVEGIDQMGDDVVRCSDCFQKEENVTPGVDESTILWLHSRGKR